MVDKVIATPVALELVAQLKAKHGPELMFHQSGGCCDNSAANCYLPGEITMGAGDVYLGEIGGCPFYIVSGLLTTPLREAKDGDGWIRGRNGRRLISRQTSQ